jgi:aminocarboxymuconate-semialdehyde decarboxylase
VLFGTDCPFDPEGGPTFIRESIRAIDSLRLARPVRNRVYNGNALRMLRLDLAGAAAAKGRAKARRK